MLSSINGIWSGMIKIHENIGTIFSKKLLKFIFNLDIYNNVCVYIEPRVILFPKLDGFHS